MALTRRDRFKLKTQIVDALEGDVWTFDRTNILLAEFGLETISGNWEEPVVADIIADLTDDTLQELYALVLDMDADEVVNVVESVSEDGNWKPGYARVFLSHSAHHKAFAGLLADELAVIGVHGFVAHDTMTVSRPWQAQIEQALRSMQAFVALVHPEFNASQWCNQEAGWAFGRRVPRFAVRLGTDPQGFLGHEQWPSGMGKTPEDVASIIGAWLTTVPELGSSIVDGLLSALETAGNYHDAEAKAKRVVAMGTLTEDQFERLDRIWWSNDQLWGGYLPTSVMQPFYKANGRGWPPPKGSSADVVANPFAEPPF